MHINAGHTRVVVSVGALHVMEVNACSGLSVYYNNNNFVTHPLALMHPCSFSMRESLMGDILH